MHNALENWEFITLASGTWAAGNLGGTATGVANAGAYEYHVLTFLGTLANHGTLNVYAVTNTGGSSPRVLATLNVGSANGDGAAIEVKSSALGTFASTGTVYSYLAGCGTVESGGTWRGALAFISHQPRVAPTSNGLAASGSRYT